MKTFRDALLEATQNGGPSLKKVAEESGVSYEQLKKLKQGKTQNTNVEDARRIAKFFGQSLEEFIDSPEMKVDIDLAVLLSGLEVEDREFLLKVAREHRAALDRSRGESAPEDP